MNLHLADVAVTSTRSRTVQHDNGLVVEGKAR